MTSLALSDAAKTLLALSDSIKAADRAMKKLADALLQEQQKKEALMLLRKRLLETT